MKHFSCRDPGETFLEMCHRYTVFHRQISLKMFHRYPDEPIGMTVKHGILASQEPSLRRLLNYSVITPCIAGSHDVSGDQYVDVHGEHPFDLLR